MSVECRRCIVAETHVLARITNPGSMLRALAHGEVPLLLKEGLELFGRVLGLRHRTTQSELK